MDILPGALFYIYTSNMLVKAVTLPKHMIEALATNPSTYIIHARSDESDTRGETRLNSTAHADIERVDTNNRTPQR